MILCALALWPCLLSFLSDHELLYKSIAYYGADQHFHQYHQLIFKSFLITIFVFILMLFGLNILKDQIMITILLPIVIFISYFIPFLSLVLFSIAISMLIFLYDEKFILPTFSVKLIDIRLFVILLFFLCFNFLFYIGWYYHYQSFHWAEMSLFNAFWSYKDSLTVFVPRHGLFEVFLQKILGLFFDMETVIHASMFTIKFFSVMDVYIVLIIVYALTKDYFFVFGYFLIFQLFSINPAIHWTPIAFTFFLMFAFEEQESKRFPLAFLLGIVTTTIYFLRVDIGIFLLIATTCCFVLYIFFLKNFMHIFAFLLGILTIILMMIFWYGFDGVQEFVYVTTLLPAQYNDFVWGNVVPALQVGHIISAKLLVNFLYLLIAISLAVKELFFRKNRKIIPYILLVLTTAAVFKILLGRIDARVFWFSGVLISLPIAIYFFDNSRMKKVFLISPMFIMMLFSFPSFDRSGYFAPYEFIQKGVQNLWFIKRDLISNSQEIQLLSKFGKIIAENKGKVTFLTFSPYAYVYFDTKPVGKYTDAYQIYPFDNSAFYQQLANSNIVFWYPQNLDGIPDSKRLSKYLDYLENTFDVFYQDLQITVYTNKVRN